VIIELPYILDLKIKKNFFKTFGVGILEYHRCNESINDLVFSYPPYLNKLDTHELISLQEHLNENVDGLINTDYKLADFSPEDNANFKPEDFITT